MRGQPPFALWSPLLAAILIGTVAEAAQPSLVQPAAAGRAPLIAEAAAGSARSLLAGNVYARATPGHDQGAVPATLRLGDLALILKRSPAQNRALEQFLSSQQDPRSPLYHHWLTAAQFGAQFGAADADISTLSAWLKASGFAVRAVSQGRSLIHFSGTAAQVEAAFGTPIHYFDDQGRRRWANVGDPQIPEAFLPALAGITGLHNFPAAPQHHGALQGSWQSYTQPPQFTTGTAGTYGVGPADFSTIYNLQPLINKGITGSGVKIAIAAQSNISPSIAPAYWSAFGVVQGQVVTVVVPTGVSDPGETADSNESEADLDVEIAGGVALDAQLVLIPSASAATSAEYAIDNNVAPILSISFGECEATLTTATSAQISTLYQEAAALGITVVVASGDQLSATCDSGDLKGPAPATHGLSVNGFASTPYDTAVGGTDFNLVGIAPSQYWAASNTPDTFASALSYMPEMAWNSSCANPVLLTALPSYPSVEAICNNPSFASFGVIVSGSGGGLSTVYAQPSWQVAMAASIRTTSRAVPDLSFFASNGFSGVAWVICSYVNTTCAPAGSAGAAVGYDLVGGTSASTPAFAGIMALLLQTQVSPGNPDGRQGLINPILYQLAAGEYGSSQTPNAAALANCNSSNGNAVGGSCIFYDITTGSNAAPCATGSLDCVTQTSGDAYGVLGSNGVAAYSVGTGFDLATGLGSLNVTNFVTALWIPAPPTALTAASGEGMVTLQWNASNLATTYNIYQGSASGAEAAAPALSAVAGTQAAIPSLRNGDTYYFRIDALNAGGTSGYSNEVRVTVLPSTPSGLAASAGIGSATLSWAASTGANSYSVYRGTSAGGEGSSPIQTGISGTTFASSGLSDGQSYFFRVAAVNAGGTSTMSNEASATPTAPSGGGGGGGLGLLDLVALALMGGLGSSARLASRARSRLDTRSK